MLTFFALKIWPLSAIFPTGSVRPSPAEHSSACPSTDQPAKESIGSQGEPTKNTTRSTAQGGDFFRGRLQASLAIHVFLLPNFGKLERSR